MADLQKSVSFRLGLSGYHFITYAGGGGGGEVVA